VLWRAPDTGGDGVEGGNGGRLGRNALQDQFCDLPAVLLVHLTQDQGLEHAVLRQKPRQQPIYRVLLVDPLALTKFREAGIDRFEDANPQIFPLVL
jgi:hypothetical protein